MELTRLKRSKALESAGYDAATRTLRLRFRHGGLYDYLDVPPEVFEGLTTSAHPWTSGGRTSRRRTPSVDWTERLP